MRYLPVFSFFFIAARHYAAATTATVYYGSKCSGDSNLVTVPINGNCLQLYNFHQSVYTKDLQPCEALSAFKPSSVNAGCGYALCTIVGPYSGCSSSSQKNVKGLAIHDLTNRQCESNSTSEYLGSMAAVPRDAAPPTGEVCVDAWKAGMILQVAVAEDKNVQVPNTRGAPPTQEEILAALVAAGYADSAQKHLDRVWALMHAPMEGD